MGSTVLLGGAATGVCLWATSAPCELLKNMDVSGLVLNENMYYMPYCIRIKYKKENGTIYYHCYKFFLVFEYEKGKKEVEKDERNNCYVALKVVEGIQKGSTVTSDSIMLPLMVDDEPRCRYPNWEKIRDGEREDERNAIMKALDFVFDRIIENEIQYMKDKGNNKLYNTGNRKKLKDLMFKMVGNNIGERGKGEKSPTYFDFTQLNIEEMEKLKEETSQFVLKSVGKIGDCPRGERTYLCDGEILNSDGGNV